MSARKITLDKRFGKLVTESWYSKRNKSDRSQIWYHCKCDCGNYHDVKSDILKCGECQACPNCTKSSKFIRTGKVINPKRYYAKIVRRCKTTGLELSISLDDIKKLLEAQKNKCKLSGVNISIEDGTASLDRIDSEIGYITSNLQWLHRTVNYMKNELDQDTFLDFCSKISKQAEGGYSR